MATSDLLAPILWLLSGVILGHLIPRLPTIIMSRFSFFNPQLPPHPAPVPVDGYLLARVLLMRNLRALGLFFSLIPLILGWLAIIGADSPFGVGLVLGAVWTLLSWSIPEKWGSTSWPWSRSLAEDLQQFRNQSRDENSRCCDSPELFWEVACIRCAACLKVIDSRPRPDLGRKRSDGWFMGALRVWMLDGKSPLGYVELKSNPSIEEE